MKHTLTLSGSASALIAAMSAFEEATAGSGQAGNPTEASATTATAMPAPPAATATEPAGSTPIPAPPAAPAQSDEAEEGDDSDGTGVDSDGLPWDDRIHSSSKKKGKDGTWNKRRGGPDGDERAAIEAELRDRVTAHPNAETQQAMQDARDGNTVPVAPAPTPPVPQAPSAPAAPAAPPPMPPVAPAPAPAAPPPMPPAGNPTDATPTPTPAPVPTAPEPTTAPADTTPAATTDTTEWDFTTFMQQAGPKFGEGDNQLSTAYLSQVCQTFGIGSITDAAPNPELIGKLVVQFQADGRW